ncbi:MAG: DUF4202 family protein [Patescibacteria group bacterium]
MDYFSLARQFVVHSFEKSGDVQPLRHFDRTVYWVEQLMPNADEAMRVAAFAHDIERAFRDRSKEPVGRSAKGFRDDFYIVQHPAKGAEIIGRFLTERKAPESLIARVKMLIEKHEVGGNMDQNILKDADSVSFLENQIQHFLTDKLKRDGAEKIAERFEWMYSRITSQKAKEFARPFYEDAMKRLKP